MKLIFSIVQDRDAGKLVKELTRNKFQVTKLCSSGGFLKSGNTTLLVGTETERLNTVIELIKKNSKSRKQLVDSSLIPYGMEGMFSPYPDEIATSSPSLSTGFDGISSTYPIEVIVGGATIFVLNVEHFAKR